MTTLRSPFARAFTDSAAVELATALKVLADPSRLAIVSLLHANGSMTVSDLTAALPIGQPTVSHHLRLLDNAGLVTRRETGRFTYRSLRGGRMDALAHLLAPGAQS